MSEVERYADKAMFPATPMKSIVPKVHLLWMTRDPLGAVAAASRMYEGKPTYSLNDVDDEERRRYWEEMGRTHLKAPLEFVKLHFMIEGVDRAFTHQLVRQRTAVYAQESLRFAVKEELASEVPYPPSFKYVPQNVSSFNDLADTWDSALKKIEEAYKSLIANGVPAEDARGLLPTAVTTRIHYCTDLRNLLEHAGNRLCTQAQFHWRSVFLQIAEVIRTYPEQLINESAQRSGYSSLDIDQYQYLAEKVGGGSWQFELIAGTAFKPQCYLQNRCTFKADFDRGCTIRNRVDEFEKHGIPSTEWGFSGWEGDVAPIAEIEWMEDPQAGWVQQAHGSSGESGT